MSVTLTQRQVVDRSKTQTRRLGWVFLKRGDHLSLCRKVMGRKHADGTLEPLDRLAEVEVVDVRREPLNAITAEDCAAEGFPEFSPAEFVKFFCERMKCTPDTWVTRIVWRYLDCGNSDA